MDPLHVQLKVVEFRYLTLLSAECIPIFSYSVGFVGKVKNWSEKSPSCCYLNQGNTPGTVDFPVCFSMSGIKLIPTIEIWVVDPLLGSLGVLGVLWCTSFQDVRMWLLIDFVVLHFYYFFQSKDNSKLDLSNEWLLNDFESQLLRLKKQWRHLGDGQHFLDGLADQHFQSREGRFEMKSTDQMLSNQIKFSVHPES